LRAIEIDNVVAYNSLPIKLEVLYLPFPDPHPKKGFGLGYVLPKVSGKFFKSLVVREHLIIPPNPPLEKGGRRGAKP